MFMLVCFWLVSQASLLRLPICFSRAGKKQNGSDFEFAFCRAGKKQNGSDFQFAFSRAGKKQNGSDFEFAFSQPGKKQNGSDFHGNKQRLRGSSPRPSAYGSSALSIRPHTTAIAFFRLCKSKLDVQFAFPAQTSNLLFPGPGKSKIGSLSHFAFTQPRAKASWMSNLLFRLGQFCFFQAREKANWMSGPFCFLPAREKANWMSEILLFPNWKSEPFAFSRPGKKQIGCLNHSAFSRAGKKQNGSLSLLLFPGPGKSKLDVSTTLLFPGPGKSRLEA